MWLCSASVNFTSGGRLPGFQPNLARMLEGTNDVSKCSPDRNKLVFHPVLVAQRPDLWLGCTEIVSGHGWKETGESCMDQARPSGKELKRLTGAQSDSSDDQETNPRTRTRLHCECQPAVHTRAEMVIGTSRVGQKSTMVA